ncbi:MAG: hypothetical protein KDD62_12125, partial [Bdellovibrionales bacterium]|nr:hypothetical protein [Bdellovibrionales bacterium]
MSVKRQVNNTLNLYVESAREASLGFVRNWTVLVGCVGAYFTFQLMSILVSPLGMVGGFILGAVLLALLSFYYSWVRETVLGRKLSLQSLVDFDSALFFNLMSVAFLLWIFDGLILEPLVMSTQNVGLYRGLQMLIFLAFNPLVETVYQKGLESVEAFRYSLSFTKEHFIEWYLPLLVLVAPIILR